MNPHKLGAIFNSMIHQQIKILIDEMSDVVENLPAPSSRYIIISHGGKGG